MAIVGGFNVYPREVDEVLFAHPAVLEAAATGVPDSYYGETIRACVVIKDGAHVRTDDLLAHCRTNLAKYKVPTEIRIVQTLPRTTIGKIDRVALRDWLSSKRGEA
jgi:long-chain acyl-CoA synthetase